MAGQNLPPSCAIFSPSVARQAASTARDWNFVDSWLASKFRGRSPPSFERNTETLKALLSLAGLSESADEERQLHARAEAAALREADGPQENSALEEFRHNFLSLLEDQLSREGTAALSACANVAAEIGSAGPTPRRLASHVAALRPNLSDGEQTQARLQLLKRHIEQETGQVKDLLQQLDSDAYRPPEDMAQQNLQQQRRIKAMTPQTQERGERTMRDKVHPTIDEVATQEGAYLKVAADKASLDAQVAAFRGLPSDIDEARLELERTRDELTELTGRRDITFEGLVERESPDKRCR